MHLTILQKKIFEIRGERVMLDFDLAELYEVETKVLNQAVKRNIDKFPEDFMFRLTSDEWKSLRSQIVTLETGKGQHPKYFPYAFTEHGVTMAASVLKSEKAIKVNIAIVRAFIALRKMTLENKDLANKIKQLEKKYNKQFKDINQALNYLLSRKTDEDAFAKRERIGFKKD